MRPTSAGRFLEMDNLELMAILGSPNIDTTGYSATSEFKLLSDALEQIKEIHRKYGGAAASIRASANWTKTGKVGQLETLGTQYIDQLRMFDKLVDRARGSLEKLRSKTTIQPTESNDSSRTLKEQEVRSLLRKMDATEVQVVWFDAIDEGDQLVFDAIRNAPKFLKLILPETLEKGEAMWSEKRDPTLAKSIRDLSGAIRKVAKAKSAIAKAIANDSGLPEVDLLARLAAGEKSNG